MAFKRHQNITATTIIDNKVTEHVEEFNYLGCSVLYVNNNEIYNKLQSFNKYVEKFDTH